MFENEQTNRSDCQNTYIWLLQEKIIGCYQLMQELVV